jgi:hypothetical protein
MNKIINYLSSFKSRHRPARDISVRDAGYEPSAKSEESNHLKTVYELQNSRERDEIERSLVCADAQIE